jgi:DNA-binding LacI/PurR family transcriptional regulator
MALEAIDLARKEGLSIPQDISIIGFDDNPIAMYSSIGLTTVRQPIVEMGQLGLETLDQIVQRKVKLPVKNTLPAKLVLRESCAKPKKTSTLPSTLTS